MTSCTRSASSSLVRRNATRELTPAVIHGRGEVRDSSSHRASSAPRSLLAGWLARRAGQVRTLLIADLVDSLLLLVPVLIPTPVAIGVTAAFLGATNAVSHVILVSLRQRLIPEDLLGRVNASYRLIGMGATPLGAAAGGLLGAYAGLPAVFCTASAVCVIAVVLLSRVVSARSVAAAEEASDRPSALQPA